MNTNDDKDNNNELLQLVSFKLGNEEFGINILMVQEIVRWINITKIPNAPESIEGVVNLRGKIIPIIDLNNKLGMNRFTLDSQTRIIVVEVDKKIIGFIVDQVSEVLRIPRSITEAPPTLVSGINSEYITAIGKMENRLLILLNLEKIVNSVEINGFSDLN